MNKLFFLIIILSLILFTPVISNDKEIQDGVSTIENTCIADWLWDNYISVQPQEIPDNKPK